MRGDASIAGARGGNPAWSLRVPLHLADRRLLLLAVDLVVVNAALLLALAVRFSHGVDAALVRAHPLWFLILSATWFPAAYVFDAYHPRVTGKLGAAVGAAGKAAVLTACVYLLIPYITPPLPSSRLALASFPLLLTAAVVAWRGLYAVALPRPALQHRVVIVGAGAAGRTMAQVLVEQDGSGYQPVAFVDDAPALGQGSAACPPALAGRNGGEADRLLGSLPVVGRESLRDCVERSGVTTIILAPESRVDPDLLQAVMACAEQGVDVVPMPVLYEQLTGRVPVGLLGDAWSAALPLSHRGTSPLWRLTKRLMDIALASAGLLCFGLVLPFIALAIYLDSPGPIFYTQERVGRGGRVFGIYKLRTMVANAEDEGPLWAREDDPRITRVGRILRATHIDEWPQFLNILKGEMSAVGPRPERPEFVRMLAERIPYYPLRHAVKPGMAGWALVKQGYAGSTEEALVRFQYDLYYIKHQSLWFDVVILLKTLEHAIAFRGR
jgi:exopolysaccharide biosynthesis polyprenyl glycosylphosphotransferase